MRKITIQNSETRLLKEFLQEKLSINILSSTDTTISVNINNFNDIEELSLALAVYSVFYLENKLNNKVSNYLSQDTLNREILSQIQDYYHKYIYIEPIKILYLEYLKDNDFVKTESFITFNCRGIEKDFYKLGKDYIQLYDDEVKGANLSNTKALDNSTIKSDIDNVNSATTYYSYIKELNDMILRIKEECEVNISDYNKFNELQVKANKEQIIITDKQNNQLEDEMDSLLPINITKKINNQDTALKTAIILLTCISVFKTSSIVFHKSIPKLLLSRILLFLYDSKEINTELNNVNLLKCNFCDSCYPNNDNI